MKYSMHNIVLSDGTQTMPGKPILVETQDVKDMIEFAKIGGYKRVVDLGAGEGGYTIAFANAGFEVTAVEPRLDNIAKICKVVGSSDNLVHILPRTVEDFLKTDWYPPADTLILCLGLLYHLPDPASVLANIALCADGVILSTHYAIAHNHWQYDYVSPIGSWLLKRLCKRAPWLFRFTHYGLSHLTVLKGKWGRWYSEYPPGYKNVEALSHSSIHNHKSFWLTRSEISAICESVGLAEAGTKERTKDQSYTSFWSRK